MAGSGLEGSIMDLIKTIIVTPVITVAYLFNIVTAQAPALPVSYDIPKPEIEVSEEADPLRPVAVIKREVTADKKEKKELTVDQLIDKYFGRFAPQAKKVAMCESGMNPSAKGDVGLQFWQDGILYGASYGVFQIRYLKGRPTPDKLTIAEFNIKYASEMFKAQGWRPWTCKKVL